MPAYWGHDLFNPLTCALKNGNSYWTYLIGTYRLTSMRIYTNEVSFLEDSYSFKLVLSTIVCKQPLSHAGYKWPSPIESRVFVNIFQPSQQRIEVKCGIMVWIISAIVDRRHKMFRTTTLLILNIIQGGCIRRLLSLFVSIEESVS